MNEVRKKEQEQPSLIGKTTTYMKGVRAEWDKITWPEKRQVIVETLVVLAVVIFFTLFVYFLDIFFNFMFSTIPGGIR